MKTSHVDPPSEAAKAREVIADGLLSVEEAIEFSRLSRSRLYILMRAKKLTYATCGSRRLIPKRALVDMLAAGVVLSS